MRRLGALAALSGGLLGLGLLLASPAFAHASVVSSDPGDGARLQHAPAAVTITFDEAVGIDGVGYLHVTDQTGRRVDAAAAVHPGGDATKVRDRLRPSLGDGSYTASFRVVSADSHPVAGTIRFVVGDGALVHGSVDTSATDPDTGTAFDVSRWIAYAGLALLGGSWLLLTVWPQGRADPRARGVVRAGVVALGVGAVLEVVIQGPYAAGDGVGHVVDGALLDATLHTTYGQLHVARLVLLAALTLVVMRRPRAQDRLVAGLLVAGIAFTFAASGHAATTSPSWLSIPLDMAHLLAMAAWIGGLVMLLAALLPRHDEAELSAVLPTFSRVAFASVVTLAGTGTYAAWRGVGTVHAVVTTSYGLLVLAKVVLFLGLLALGNQSRRLVQRRYAGRPQLAYAMTDTLVERPAVDPERLRRTVYVEAVVGFVVLALTAILVAEPRGTEALAAQHREPITAVAPLDGGRSLTVTADPGTHGVVTLALVASAGVAPTALTATATQEQAQIGPIPITLAAAGPGVYDGSVDLPVAGSWRIDLVVTTSQFDATTTDTTIELH